MSWPVDILVGDCRARLRALPENHFHTRVTSPPYFGLRDYGVDGQIGLEDTPDAFVAQMVEVFREVRRVLRDDGTLWLNLGDSYAANRSYQVSQSKHKPLDYGTSNATKVPDGLKTKDLIGIPWRVAFALQADGWYLRQDIIWAKPNPMPESVTDRCTKSHEYLFLLAKSPRYYYDAEAIAEAVAPATVARLAQDVESQAGSDRVPGKTNGAMKAKPPRFGGSKYGESEQGGRVYSGNEYTDTKDGKRNRRSVWTVATQPLKDAHFATYPPALIEPCIRAGSPHGGRVLDPFGGAGTTALVAWRLQRACTLIELNPEYAEIARRRLEDDQGMWGEIAVSNPESTEAAA